MTPPQWLCYRPRVFERGGRNYQVETGGQSFPGRFLDAFTAEAEDMWRATQGQSAATWRYASLGSSSSMVLCRCALAQQGEARALVVWALLVPLAALRAERFELMGLVPFFPPGPSKGPAAKGPAAKGSQKEQPGKKAGGAWPPPPDLSALSVLQPAGPDVSGLISRYLEFGRAEVNLAPGEALPAFARVLAQLAPRDRLEASFSTTPASTHALSVSPAAAPLEALEPNSQWLSRLSLWRLACERLPQAVRDQASLRGPHLPWLAGILDRSDLAGSYADVVRAVRRQSLAFPQGVLAHLRQGLEGALAGLPEAAAAGVLSRLVADGLIHEELGVPPLWLARVVLRQGCLSDLPKALWPQLLQAPSLPMLLESVQRTPTVALLELLARMLAKMPAPKAPAAPQLSLAGACRAAMRPILAEGMSDRNLAPAVVLLLLHEHACAGSP